MVMKRWTLVNVHTVQDKRSETIAKSRSRSCFKNERNTVVIGQDLLFACFRMPFKEKLFI